MASVIGKRVNGRTYYYLATSARVAGRPRIVSQRYLGSAEDIDAAVRGATVVPQRTRHLAFGAVAAAWATLRRLGLPELVDEVVGARRAKVSIGTYFTLAVLRSAVAATKPCCGDWWATTAADRFVRPRLDPADLGQHRFTRALDQLTEEHLARIGAAVRERVTGEFDLDGDTLLVDLPRFATFVDAPGRRAEQSGSDAALAVLAGLALEVSREGAVPLRSTVYRRDEPIVPRAGSGGDERGTRVFDAGQYPQLDLAPGTRFVGSLPVGDHPDLLTRPTTALRPVDPRRFPGVSALDTRATVLGANRRVILIRSATLHAAQSRAFAQSLGDAVARLDGLAAALAAGTFRQPRERVLTEIARITRFRFGERVLSTTLTGSKPGELRLDWRVDETARRRITTEIFGRQLLVTDHDDWSVADVITAYRARYHLESTFRMVEESTVVAPSPAWRWTDQRIATRGTVRVLAATVTHLMRHEAHRAGIDLSVRDLLDQLAGIEETHLTYPSTGGRPRVRRVLTELDDTQRRLFELFGLAAYAPPE